MSAEEVKQVVKPILETYFSDYGYVIVNKNDLSSEDKLIICEGKNVKFQGRILKANLKEKINVCLKTFYGRRETFTFEMGITEKISKIIQLLLEKEKDEKDLKNKFSHNSQFRIISTSGKIKELSVNKSLVEQNIRNNQVLLILDQKKIRWSELLKGPGIYLENRNKRAVKTGEEFQMVVTDRGFNSGRHYVEITLETVPDEMSIVLGATLKRNDFYINLSDFRSFWGYILSANKTSKKIFYSNKVEQTTYGEICKINDKVGMLFEFNDTGLLDISFFVNKINMGVAFKNLPFETYFPCCILYFDGSKVKLESKVAFPDL